MFSFPCYEAILDKKASGVNKNLIVSISCSLNERPITIRLLPPTFGPLPRLQIRRGCGRTHNQFTGERDLVAVERLLCQAGQ